MEATKTKGESAEANSISLSIVAEPVPVGNYLIHTYCHIKTMITMQFLSTKPELPAIVVNVMEKQIEIGGKNRRLKSSLYHHSLKLKSWFRVSQKSRFPAVLNP